MTNDKNLDEQLLRQNGIEPDRLSDEDHNNIQKMIATDKMRLKRLKRMTIIAWISTIICIIMYYTLAFNLPTFNLTLGTVPHTILLWIAVACTILLYIRSRSANMRQLQARLANIEEQLKRLSKNS